MRTWPNSKGKVSGKVSSILIWSILTFSETFSLLNEVPTKTRRKWVTVGNKITWLCLLKITRVRSVQQPGCILETTTFCPYSFTRIPEIIIISPTKLENNRRIYLLELFSFHYEFKLLQIGVELGQSKIQISLFSSQYPGFIVPWFSSTNLIKFLCFFLPGRWFRRTEAFLAWILFRLGLRKCQRWTWRGCGSSPSSTIHPHFRLRAGRILQEISRQEKRAPGKVKAG